jgi:hypothetical protein
MTSERGNREANATPLSIATDLAHHDGGVAEHAVV